MAPLAVREAVIPPLALTSFGLGAVPVAQVPGITALLTDTSSIHHPWPVTPPSLENRQRTLTLWPA